jgi:multidrug resistance efflux pump
MLGRGDFSPISVVSADPIPVAADNGSALKVDTILPTLQPILVDRTLMGTLEAVDSVTLTSRVMGRLQELPWEAGDRVEKGDVIARIDVSDLQATRQQAQSQIQQAQAAALVTQASYSHAQAELNRTQAQLLEAEAELADAQLQQRRMQSLHQEGAVSKSTLDEANTRVAVRQARIEQITAAITQAESTIQQQEALIRQAEAAIQQAEALLAQAQANLSYGVVTAPFTGVITQKLAEVGSITGPGQSLVHLESTDQVRFRVAVPEGELSQLQLGQSVTVSLDALGQEVEGILSQIIPSADPVARSVVIKVDLPPLSNAIPGLFGRLILASPERTALLIPADAVVERLGITGVFQVVDQQARFTPVVVGAKQGQQVEIYDGLTLDQAVVRNPSSQLQHGQPLASS